ncbi:MAG: carboxyl transferase domain-containing protein [Candidatus Nanopelagicales bacterium]
MARTPARVVLEAVLDPGSFRSWDTPALDVAADPGYAEELRRAREATGLDESLITGEGTIEGRRVAVAVCEFDFLAGSIGVAAAERFVAAVERATRERLPLVASPTSGGTRMQEGTVAFLQMVKISAAVMQHRRSGLPYLAYLRHPTTGGVFASWGSLAHVTAAEPGALVGFLGPRVYSALYGEEFPAGVQTAENLYAHGLVDAVIPVGGLREIAARVLTVVSPTSRPPSPEHLPADAEEDLARADLPAWDSVLASRRPDRPGVRALLRVAGYDVTPLNGTGRGESEPGLLLALARFGAASCVVLGQDRRGQEYAQPLGPGALRTARRGMKLAGELGLPLVTVVDTQGAALSREAEEGGLAGEIARSLADLALHPSATVCLLLGQGTGGGALALLPADRVVAAQHAWLSPLPPEGASAILHRTPDRAAEMAERQGVRALDLRRHGIVDRIVPERPDAADEPQAFLHRVGLVLAHELLALADRPDEERRADRLDRFRRLGLPGTVGEPGPADASRATSVAP